MSQAEHAPRGPALRPKVSAAMLNAVREQYGIAGDVVRDLGGSSNLNLLLEDAGRRYVARVHRPWVTSSRLADVQAVRRELARGGVPCALPLETRGGDTWIVVEDRLVEVEPYVEHDANMDSWQRLEVALPLLGRTHELMRPLEVSEDGRHPPAANHVAASEALAWTSRGTNRIRKWHPSPSEQRLADASEELARLLAHAERESVQLPRHLVHGDFWDNNVLFHKGRVVLVADLDFMGERLRIDDLALVLYYANSTFWDDPLSADRMRKLRGLVDAYDSGLTDHLTTAERAALPLALARTPLCFVGMVASVDTEVGAKRLAAEICWDVAWALALVRDLDRWQTAFA